MDTQKTNKVSKMIIYKIETNPKKVDEFKILLEKEGLQFDIIITDNQPFHKFRVQEPISDEQKLKIENFLEITRIEIPPEEFNRKSPSNGKFLEILIKTRGELWKHHQNDPDTHRPKNHCHNNEDNEYIDPLNGIIYDAKTNSIKRQCKKHNLEIIQNRLREKGIQL